MLRVVYMLNFAVGFYWVYLTFVMRDKWGSVWDELGSVLSASVYLATLSAMYYCAPPLPMCSFEVPSEAVALIVLGLGAVLNLLAGSYWTADVLYPGPCPHNSDLVRAAMWLYWISLGLVIFGLAVGAYTQKRGLC